MATSRKYPPMETRDRIRMWCDQQERPHSGVRRKLVAWGVYGEEAEDIIATLISDNYLNEERYARAFAQGKCRISKWGWAKVEAALRQKGVSAYSIRLARATFDEHFDGDELRSLLQKKLNNLRESDPYKRKQKLMRFAASRGFQMEQVQRAMEQLDW